MIRRACALLLLLTLSGQLSASLYACHHNGGAGGDAAGEPPEGLAVSATGPAHADAHDHGGPGPLRGCNRHHRGPCGHEGRGALNACSGDPAAGLQLASEGVLPQPAAPAAVAAVTDGVPAVPAPDPLVRHPSPELPPPRA